MCGVRQSCVDGAGEIEVSVAVGIRTQQLEKRLCRRMQYVRYVGACAVELSNVSSRRECWTAGNATRKRHRCPIATQPVSALLARGGAGRRKAHPALPELPPEIGSAGVADASDWVASRFSPRVLGRADRRCCFSC